MGRLFVLMGKSSSGKDTVFQKLKEDKTLAVKTVVPYTTRPIREGETDGKEYFFINEMQYETFKKQGKIIEERAYDTVFGIWRYMTIDDGQMALDRSDYMIIGTLEAFFMMKTYFGSEKVIPVYMEVADDERLLRAIYREQQQEHPSYEEVCRRFLADAKDFSKERLKEAGIKRHFLNKNLLEVTKEVAQFIKEGKGQA